MTRTASALILALAFFACDNPAAPAADNGNPDNQVPGNNNPGGNPDGNNPDGGNPDGGNYVPAGAKVFDPNLPATTFQSVTDQAEREKLINELWAAMAAPQCWDASFVGPMTPGGYAASVSQFTFSGQGQFRYVGFETHVGSISLVDVGKYLGRPAVLLSTWSGNTEGIILVDKNRFEHVNSTPDGSSYYSVTFWTSAGPCL